MVGVSASANLPLHHKVWKFSSGTSSPGWSRGKKAVKQLWWWFHGTVSLAIQVSHIILFVNVLHMRYKFDLHFLWTKWTLRNNTLASCCHNLCGKIKLRKLKMITRNTKHKNKTNINLNSSQNRCSMMDSWSLMNSTTAYASGLLWHSKITSIHKVTHVTHAVAM